MRKILLIFNLFFLFTIIGYGQNISITNEKIILNVYDNQTILLHNDYGMIRINNNSIVISAKGFENKNNILGIGITKENIYCIVEKSLFKSTPTEYYLKDFERKYNIKNCTLKDNTYIFELPLQHFKEIKNDNIPIVVVSDNGAEGWHDIGSLIKFLQLAENYIKNYPLYNKYIK